MILHTISLMIFIYYIIDNFHIFYIIDYFYMILTHFYTKIIDVIVFPDINLLQKTLGLAREFK